MSSQQDAAREEAEKNRAAKFDALNLQDEEGPQADYLHELMKTDFSLPQKEILSNLASQDFSLANYSDAEVQELKADLMIIKEKFIAMHPGQESKVQGLTRAWAYDEPDERLTALTDQERLELDSFLKAVFSRVTRGKDFAQQEILSTSISEVRRNEDSSSSGGLLGRLRS